MIYVFMFVCCILCLLNTLLLAAISDKLGLTIYDILLEKEDEE